MNIDKNRNIIFFDNDDEFTDFCISSEPIVRKTQTGIPYYDYDYTDIYNKAVMNGVQFNINDSNSRVMKNGCVTRRTVSKPVSNICEASICECGDK